MNYIVIDMEWNQPYGKGAFRTRKGIVLNGEIIQIGAVKMSENGDILSTFKINIKPKKYTKINSKVKKLTKITQGEMNKGTDLYTAADRFKKWCGEDFVFVSWGYDDIPILKANLDFFDIPSDWLPDFYNAQVFFVQQTDNNGRQYSLDYAMEYFGIHTDKAPHDALNDAYHTALICAEMDFALGTEEYEKIISGDIIFKDGLRGEKVSEELSCITKNTKKALNSAKIAQGNCPFCRKRLKFKDVLQLSVNRYAILCQCKNHGDFINSFKFSKTRGKNIHVIRNTFVFETENIDSKFEEWKEKYKKEEE